jgi:hypothetical protein
VTSAAARARPHIPRKANGFGGAIAMHKAAVSAAPGPQMCVLPAFGGDPLANSGNGQLHALDETNR